MIIDEGVMEKEDYYILGRMKEFVSSDEVSKSSAAKQLLILIERAVGRLFLILSVSHFPSGTRPRRCQDAGQYADGTATFVYSTKVKQKVKTPGYRHPGASSSTNYSRELVIPKDQANRVLDSISRTKGGEFGQHF